MTVRAIGTIGLLLVALTSASTSASIAAASSGHPAKRTTTVVTPADRAATHAYLLATQRWDEAQLADAAQSTAAAESFAGQMSSTCPHVLAGSPPHEAPGESSSVGPSSDTPSSARIEGELHRQSKQRENLRLEVSFAFEGSAMQPNREAALAYTNALAPLKWSNPVIALSLHLTDEFLLETLNVPAPPACSDMQSWVASGYRSLSPASKSFAKVVEALIKRAFEVVGVALSTHAKPFPQILSQYESAADRALARHNEELNARLHGQEAHREAIATRLEAALGLPVEESKPIPRRKKPPVIARGRTAAGGHFVVRAERLSRSRHRAGCTTDTTIEEPARTRRIGVQGIFNVHGTGRCLSRYRVDSEQQVSCGSGLLTVEASLLPAARSVRMLLSDHRTITSPAIRVPARLGGPAGLYYQVVRGPSPIPVSLAELDAQGHTLTVLKLHAVVECTKHPHKVFPHGIVRLVHENVPQGPPFTIRAERYRELGHVHFELKFDEPSGEELFSGGSGGGLFEQSAEEGTGQQAGQVFASHTFSSCKPQPYAIVYGLLGAPRDTVSMRTPSGLVPLRKVEIPARLHADGVLAYGVFSPIPTEMVIQDEHGTTIARRDLSEAAAVTTATCEGEAEG